MNIFPILIAVLMGTQTEAPPSLATKWELSQGLTHPESVSYDPNLDCLFVSDRGAGSGQGFIAKLSLAGEPPVERWVSGLQQPMGLAVHGDTLYVVDGKSLVAIDTGAAGQRHRFPGNAAGSPRNVAVASDGRVFVSDMEGNRIYTLSSGKLTTFSHGPHLHQPNALYHQEGQLFIACWGGPEEQGEIRVLPEMEDAVTSLWSAPIGRLSGIAPDGRDGFFVCDRQNGVLSWVSPSGRVQRLTALGKGVAGLCFIVDKDLLVAVNPEQGKATAIHISFGD